MGTIYICAVCGYNFDGEAGDMSNGVSPNSTIDDLPDNWVCPVCRASKSAFEEA